MIIIAKNTTGSDIELQDMYGITVPASSETNLTNQVPFPIIEGSLELKDYVNAGDIVINDGTDDLSISHGIRHLTTSTCYETPHEIDELNDVATKESNKILRSTVDGTAVIWVDPVDNIDDLQDVPAKPGTGDYVLRTVDGTLEWIDTTSLTDHVHTLPDHAIDEHTDIPTKPTTGDYILEVKDGTPTWVDSTAFINHEHIHNHDLDDLTDVPTKPTSGNKILESQSGTLTWIDTPSSGGGGSGDIHVTFGNDSGHKNTGCQTTWAVMREFIFPGSTSVGTPQYCKIIAWVNKDNYPGSIRLYDRTNNNTIAEWLNFDNEDEEVKADNSLQNIPTGEAVLEIQAKAGGNGSSKSVYISAFLMKF